MNGDSWNYHKIFWKSVMRTFRCIKVIYLYALTDLNFLLRSEQNCKKCTFFDNLRTITRTITFTFTFENSQHSFSCGPPLWPVLVCENTSILGKSYRFGQSIILWHPEVTKNPYYVLSPEGSQNRYELMN